MVPETRQNINNQNKEINDSEKNYRLSRFNFYKSKQNKNNLLKKITKISEEN
jgi:hypothetical protein